MLVATFPERRNGMRPLLIALAFLGIASPALAQFTVTYSGTQSQGGGQVPASAQFSVEDGHAAMLMKGSRSGRMIFDAKAQVLHIINDGDQTYFDIDKSSGGAGDPMQMMQQQLEKMPAAQRAQTEQMMKSMMGSMPSQLTYVASDERKTIAGYECTRFEGMRGSDKVTEYYGSTSPDFAMSPAERKTMLEMQGYLRNFSIMVKGPDDSMRAFQWDTSTDGYPVLTRCFTRGQMTLELTLQTLSRQPIPGEIFRLPKGYKKLDISKMGGRLGH
jgi:hypothetical protein